MFQVSVLIFYCHDIATCAEATLSNIHFVYAILCILLKSSKTTFKWPTDQISSHYLHFVDRRDCQVVSRGKIGHAGCPHCIPVLEQVRYWLSKK